MVWRRETDLLHSDQRRARAGPVNDRKRSPAHSHLPMPGTRGGQAGPAVNTGRGWGHTRRTRASRSCSESERKAGR
jgi:hypothetical protein